MESKAQRYFIYRIFGKNRFDMLEIYIDDTYDVRETKYLFQIIRSRLRIIETLSIFRKSETFEFDSLPANSIVMNSWHWPIAHLFKVY